MTEEYPLLNPDAKSDKPVLNQSSVIAVDWDVTHSPKRFSWISRWRQFLSACWVSVVLLTILFVVFYAFGSIYRLQSLVILKHNDAKPAREVYYHYLMPRDNSMPFKTFTNYLSFMATTYPLLNFNVRLLIDDTPQSSFYFSNSRRFKRFFPKYYGPINYVSIKSNDRDIEDIQRKHRNVNVSVLSMSKYTDKTPLQLKWRSIPAPYLSFYVGVYDVWKNGGIGLNLFTQNFRFNALKRIDFKLDNILKQHSKSVDLPKYTEALDSIDFQDEKELFAVIFEAFNEIPRMFQTFYNFKIVDNEDMHAPPITSNRVKRSIIIGNEILENTTHTGTKSNVSDNASVHAVEAKLNDSKALNTTISIKDSTAIKYINNNVSVTGIKVNDSGITKKDSIIAKGNYGNVKDDSGDTKETKRINNTSHWYYVYELSGAMDNIAALFDIVENTPNFHIKNNPRNYLILESDGSIVAAYSRNHPLLLKLLTTKILKYSPRFIILDTIRDTCFRSMYNADYCDSIKIFNNL